MKGLLLKILSTLLIIYFFFAAYINFRAANIFHDLYAVIKFHKYQTQRPFTPNLLIGNSQLMNAADPEKLKSAKLLVAPGGSTMEFYYLLKNHLENNQKPEKVILFLSPSQIFWGHTFWKVNLKYGFYNLSEIIELLQTTWNHNSWIDFTGPILTFERENNPMLLTLKVLLHQFNFFPYYQKDIQLSLLDNQRLTRNQIMLKKLERTRGMHLLTGYENFSRTINSGLVEFRKKKKSNFIPSKLFEVYLKRIISLLNKKDIKFKIAIMPIRYKEGSNLGNHYFDSFESYIKLNKANTFTLPRLLDGKYFFDALHVNQKGREALYPYLNDSKL